MQLKLKDVIIVSLLGVVGFILSMFSSTITQMFGTYGVFVHVVVYYVHRFISLCAIRFLNTDLFLFITF